MERSNGSKADSRDAVVSIRSLCKTYLIGSTVVEALRGVSLEVMGGEFISIHGPSGAGKTTLLNIIGAIDKPTDGSVMVLGHDLSCYDEDFLATFRCVNMGYVYQSYNLISTLTALENIAFPMQLADWPQKRVETYSREMLELVKMTYRADHFPDQLSGGEMQRVAFARALANCPLILLADEPTGNLDYKTGLEIIRILKEMKGDKTVIVSTHDQRIMDVSDRVLHLVDGRICQNE